MHYPRKAPSPVTDGEIFDSLTAAAVTPSAAKHPRPAYRLTLQFPTENDAIRLLRAALKTLLRRFGIRCLRVEDVSDRGSII